MLSLVCLHISEAQFMDIFRVIGATVVATDKASVLFYLEKLVIYAKIEINVRGLVKEER